jgi:endogenous inhibitor of DNA gyrase (YacG/DUF329 family)
MPQVRNFYYRPVRCPLCQKEIKESNKKWFCSKKCEEEWKKLNGDLKPSSNKKIRGRDTSS